MSYRCYVHQSNEEADDGYEQRALPLLEVGKTIANGGHCTGCHRYVRADAQHEEHEEEEHGEDLRQLLELGYGIRIGNEGQAGATFDHLANVIGTNFVGQMAQNAKDREARQERGGCVQGGHNGRIPVHIVTEFIVRRVHDDVAKANGQRVEALGDRRVPHLRIQDLAPIGLDEVVDAVQRAGQGDGAYQQDAHDDVREEGQEIGRLAGALHAASYDQKDAQPGHEQANDQLPVGQANAIGYLVLLTQHLLAKEFNGKPH